MHVPFRSISNTEKLKEQFSKILIRTTVDNYHSSSRFVFENYTVENLNFAQGKVYQGCR